MSQQVVTRAVNIFRGFTDDQFAALRAELAVGAQALPDDRDAAARTVIDWFRGAARPALSGAQSHRVDVLYNAAAQPAQTRAAIIERGEQRWGKSWLTPGQVSSLNSWHYMVLNAPVEASALDLYGLAPADALSILGY